MEWSSRVIDNAHECAFARTHTFETVTCARVHVHGCILRLESETKREGVYGFKRMEREDREEREEGGGGAS